MSKQKNVVTINGEELPISQTKKFPAGYYKIGNTEIENSGDCYLINGSYFRLETGKIVFNHTIKQYVTDMNNLIDGIVKFENNRPVFGKFNYDPTTTVTIVLEDHNTHSLLNIDLVKNNKLYRERLSDGIYYHIKALAANKFNQILVPSQEYKTSLPYDSKGITDEYLAIYNRCYNAEILPNISAYAPLIGDLTFGLEFETIKGYIPSRILDPIGLIPLRDGSISGIEYVTVPLQGARGLQTVLDILEPLKERTQYDDSCSLHLHIGNVPRTKEFILAFYKLTCAMQDSIYTMFPLYKKYNFRIKNKNYSQPYPIYDLLSQMDNVITSKNIDENFNILYEFLSEGESFYDRECNLDNVKVHPRDPQGNQKWNIHTRYFIHNLIPLIFGNKKTIEFRIHTPTYNEHKIISFILMSSILTNFTIKYEKEILGNKKFLTKRSLHHILCEYIGCSNIKNPNHIAGYLQKYINQRVSATEQQNQQGLIKGDENKIGTPYDINWKQDKIVPEFQEYNDVVRGRSNTKFKTDSKGTLKTNTFRPNVLSGMDRARYYDTSALEQSKQAYMKSILSDNVIFGTSGMNDIKLSDKSEDVGINIPTYNDITSDNEPMEELFTNTNEEPWS